MLLKKKYKPNQESDLSLETSLSLFNFSLNAKRPRTKNLKVCSRFPFFISKLQNFNKGSSAFLVLRDLLLRKQIGTSIILFIKKDVNEDSLKERCESTTSFDKLSTLYFKGSKERALSFESKNDKLLNS